MSPTKKILLFVSFQAFLCFQSYAAQTEEGWARLARNDDTGAIASFKTALAENPADVRANLGMSFALSLRLDDDLSWMHLAKAIDASENPQALLYATAGTRQYFGALYNGESGVERLWEEMISNPDSLGIMRAMAYEHLAIIHAARGDVESSMKWTENTGAISTWRLIGPFNNISASGHDKRFPPEITDDTSGTYEGLSGCMVHWFEPKAVRIDRWIDHNAYFPWVTGVFYAVVYAKSPVAQTVHFRLGTSGAFKLFLNDSLVGETIDECNNDLDTYNYEVTLPEGWNKILVKVDNSELDRCNFLFRITNGTGDPVKGLELSTKPQTYTSRPVNARQIDNPFIAYFHRQISRYPERYENYLLLAEAYLRNDHITDAQRIIKSLLLREPDFICALNLLIESYRRSRRPDDQISTIERISALRPDLPVSVSYSFDRAVNAERIDDAEELAGKLKTMMPNSVVYYDAALEVARKRNNISAINSVTASAFQNHPGVVKYASAYIALAVQTDGRFEAALEIAEKHLKANYSVSGLTLKARIYLADGKIDQWRNVLMQALALDPSWANAYLTMAETYTDRKEYEKAIESIQNALAIAPTNSRYWYLLGNLYRTVGHVSNAVDCMEKAIAFNPASFGAREMLRELRGKPDPFSYFPTYNIDSLIAAAPGAQRYPEADAVYLLLDSRKVVYNGSRISTINEVLIRILTSDGIDQFKEIDLPGSDSHLLSVDKAVVRKANGREIPADVSAGKAVFKGLEEGDFMYLKTRSREAASGTLSKYFYDRFVFNSFLPVQIGRYSMLIRRSEDFQYATANAAIEPKIIPIDSSDLYIWELKDQPAVEYEAGMPGLLDVGAVIRISSIKSWREIVNWYHDIARTKTRSAPEIKDVVDSLFADNQVFTKHQIIEGVYRYITTNIRYSYVPFRQSGIVPQKARDVLLTRIGDCKDVATLCISMLAERNIPAYHVLVDTYSSPLTTNLLPSVDFDHAVVLVELEQGPIFIDLTAADVPIGSIPSADLDAMCLVIKPGWSLPSQLNRSHFTPNNVTLFTNVLLNSDLSATISQEFTHTGGRTQAFRAKWKNATQKELEKDLNESLSEDFADVKLEDYNLTNLDTLSSSLSFSLKFTVRNFTSEAGMFQMIRVPWYNPYRPVSALSYQTRFHPYEFWEGIDTLTETVTISIPAGYEIIGSKETLEYSNPAAQYRLSVLNDDKAVHLQRRVINIRRIVMPHEYQAYKEYYNNVVRSDRQSLLLAPRGTEVRTPKPVSKDRRQ